MSIFIFVIQFYFAISLVNCIAISRFASFFRDKPSGSILSSSLFLQVIVSPNHGSSVNLISGGLLHAFQIPMVISGSGFGVGAGVA